MNRRFAIAILLLICGGSVPLLAQNPNTREFRQAYANPEELVSMSRSTRFQQAMEILNEFSRKFTGKVLVSPRGMNDPIGVNIERMHWLSALEAILTVQGLRYEEGPGFLQIVDGAAPRVETAPSDDVALDVARKFETREVLISAVFFEADAGKLRELGTSWSITRLDDGDSLSVLSRAADVTGSLFEFRFSTPDFEGNNLSSIFRALEDDQVGEVISRPTITVRSGETGRIQVGSDIAVTVRDFAGNSVTQFFSTGSIIDVKPEIMVHDSIEFVLLKLQIERSSSNREEQGSVEIRKSQAETSMMLLDGEETIIGGLGINQETRTRTGVPFLKDLPWWVFGLRYVFGYESKNVAKKELLIMVKADLLPTLYERHLAKQRERGVPIEGLLKQKRREQRQQMEYLKDQMERMQEF